MRILDLTLQPDAGEDYLHDESRLYGTAKKVYFPESEADICAFMQGGAMAVTVQGARTGIAGACVPQGGDVLSFDHMKRVRGMRKTSRGYVLRVQPGLRLCVLREQLDAKAFDESDWDEESLAVLSQWKKEPGKWFFPPDPTEDTASIGGMTACNASGACSFLYGPMRSHVEGLRVVLSDGDVLSLARGDCMAKGRTFALKTEGGALIQGMLPTSFSAPDMKCTAGYFVDDSMDLLDLFIGSEGTLGVFSEMDILLQPRPGVVCGVLCELPDVSAVPVFVQSLRKCASLKPLVAAIEYFDEKSIALLRERQAAGLYQELAIPKGEGVSAIYCEIHAQNDAGCMDAVEVMCDLLESAGGNSEKAWFADTALDMHRMKIFRHAVPESVNALVAEKRKTCSIIKKLGTDMVVSDKHLDEVLRMYGDGLHAMQIDYVIFGHIGNNHLHVNMLPDTAESYDLGQTLYGVWADQIVEWGGAVAGEHGIGKLKTVFLEKMIGSSGVAEMKRLKALFDPEMRLSKGNLFVVAPSA